MTALLLLLGTLPPVTPSSFAEDAVLDPTSGTFVPIKPYEAPVNSELDGLETPITVSEEETATEENPLSEPTVEDPEKSTRDLEEYSFEEALDYLTPDYAAAVIVKSLSENDLKKLTELDIEVGIAVIGGKIVLFTSGSGDEILLLPPAYELLKEASLIAHTHPQDEAGQPSALDLTAAGENVEYVVSVSGVYAYNQSGLLKSVTYDYGYLVRKIQEEADSEAPAKPVRDLLNRFIQSVDDYNRDSEGSLLFRSSHLLGPVSPSAAITPETMASLPGNLQIPYITQVAPEGNTTTVNLAPRGITINYDTTVGGWAGGGFTYDNFGSVPIETEDLSGLAELHFSLQGDTSEVKLEIIDRFDQKSTVQLVGIQPDQEQVWVIPTSALEEIDLSNVRIIYFIVEGDGKIGTLTVNRVPSTTFIAAPPSDTLTPADISPIPGKPAVRDLGGGGGTVSAAATARGAELTFNNASSLSFAGAGFGYDDFTTPGIVETQDLSGLTYLMFGLKGDTSQVKLEIHDTQDGGFSIPLLGIRPDQEQVYAIPISVFGGADLANVRDIWFVVEGGPQAGKLIVNRQPVPPSQITVVQAPSNPDYEFLIFDSDSSGKELRLRNKVTGQIYFLLNLGPSENVSALDVDPSGRYALMNAPEDESMGMLESRKTLIFDITHKQFVKPTNALTSQPIDTVFGQTQSSFGASPYQFAGGVAIFNSSAPLGASQRGIFINLNGSVPVLSETVPYVSGNLPILDLNRGTSFSPQLVFNGSRILFYAQNTSGRHLGLYNVATGELSIQPLPFLASSPSDEFILKAVSPDGRFAIYRDAWDFIYAVDYQEINRPIQYFQIPGLDPAFLGSLGATADFRLDSATFLDSNTVEAFLVNGERFLLHIDAGDFRLLEGPRVTPASTTLTPADITPIPAGFQIGDRSPQDPAQVTATTRGFLLNYDTNTAGYSGGVVKYTTPADFSGLTDLVVGLQGNVSQAILEIWSFDGTTARVTALYLTGISATQEKVFAIPTALLGSLGIDITAIASLRFMVEGPHQEGPSRQGVLEVNFVPETRFSRPIDGLQRPIPRANRPGSSEPEVTPDTVMLMSAAWHLETLLETRSAQSNTNFTFSLYEIDDSETGITRELRLKNGATGEIYSLGVIASTETLHAFDVDPEGKFAFVNLKNTDIPEGGTFKIYDLIKQAFVQPTDPATGQAGDLLGLVDGGFRFVQSYAFFNYKDDFSSALQLKKGIVLNLAVDGIHMTRSIAIKTDQPIVFTPQGDKILFTGFDPYYNHYTYWGIYDVATGILETVQVGHRAGNDPIVAVSPDGRFAIVNHAENNEIYAFETQENSQVYMDTVPAPVQSVRFLTNELFEVTLENGEILYYTTPLTPVVYPPAPPPVPNTQLQTQVVWEDLFQIPIPRAERELAISSAIAEILKGFYGSHYLWDTSVRSDRKRRKKRFH